MTARRVALAQRAALGSPGDAVSHGEPRRSDAQRSDARQIDSQRSDARQIDAQRVTWGELGCPREIGLYRIGSAGSALRVRVKRIHIIVAEDDPAALFTIVTFRPPLGPPEHMLGHRVA